MKINASDVSDNTSQIKHCHRKSYLFQTLMKLIKILTKKMYYAGSDFIFQDIFNGSIQNVQGPERKCIFNGKQELFNMILLPLFVAVLIVVFQICHT